MSEIAFRKTLRMERGIAENDRTVLGTPVDNCIFPKQYFWRNKNPKKNETSENPKIGFPKDFLGSPSLLSALGWDYG